MATVMRLVALLVALVAVAEAGKVERESRINEEGCVKNYKVDHLTLALSWGPGYCLTSKKGCVSGVSPRFTIHGLWPQKSGELSPTFCCARDKFSTNQLNHLKGLLRTDWPSLVDQNNANAQFWEYQYMKHGRCGTKIPGLDTAYGYFSFALKLFQKWDPKLALSRANITPSNTRTYSGKKMQSVLSAAYGNKVTIDCGPTKRNPNELVLKHVRVCTDTDLNRTGCPYTKAACLGEIKFPASVY